MWHGVPFACQRRPIIGVLRMCWLLPGSFDCFCCPRASVHRPSVACLAVFLCAPTTGQLWLEALLEGGGRLPRGGEGGWPRGAKGWSSQEKGERGRLGVRELEEDGYWGFGPLQ